MTNVKDLRRPEAFDPVGELPGRGTTLLLEASAGTGKTHAIAGLAVRFVAEQGLDPGDLTVITFGRNATGELRHRLRERFLSSSEFLARIAAGDPAKPTDAIDTKLAEEKVDCRAERLAKAVADFDQVSVMTIHEFCQTMVDQLGVLATVDPAASLVEHLDQMRDEVVTDLYLKHFTNAPEPPFDLQTAMSLAREAVAKPDAAAIPDDPGARNRVDFVEEVRLELDARKKQLGIFNFDDQLARLRDCLSESPAATQWLRQRCPVVLVDEFQDTDPVQWQILREAFHTHSTLVLIGDPKQAIYSFRGADVASYNQAANAADVVASLAVNYRADEPVVARLNELFAGVELGPQIEVPPVATRHRASRLIIPDRSEWAAPVRLRTFATEEPVAVAEAREAITADLVDQVRQLMAQGAQLQTGEGPRELRASDIAVLVSTNARGRAILTALTTAGIPAAFSGSDSVFGSRPAVDWLTLLQAIADPRRQKLRKAMLTDFIGASVPGLARASDEQLSEWTAQLGAWRRVHADEGIAGLFVAVQADGTFASRVRRRGLGFRDLTDYRHVAELLHQEERGGRSLSAMLDWLAEAVQNPASAGERTRRLETDLESVQIMTIHKAKGLQFPVVLLPDCADQPRDEDKGGPLLLHDQSQRQLDVGGASSPGRSQRFEIARSEQAAESLRQFYVAATRAQSQLTLWWARTKQNTASSPLHRLIFRDRNQPGAPSIDYPLDRPPGDGNPGDLRWLDGAGIAVQLLPEAIPETHPAAPAPQDATPLEAAAWQRQIDRSWRRTSYSGITAAAHGLAPLAVSVGTEDESEPDAAADLPGHSEGHPSPMGALPGGTSFGTAVHQVFENLDWYVPDHDLAVLRDRLLTACTSAVAMNASGIPAEELAEGLLPTLLTGLGELAGGLALADLPIKDRLVELEFELPLGGATLPELARLLERGLPDEDPLLTYPALLGDPALGSQALRGYLTGSIDAVLRVPHQGGERFVVVDYKTNRISPEPELALEHFGSAAMTAEMMRNHYPLQALFYQVALHRFLRGRLPGYQPEQHLGGAGYLFLRGMGGATAAAEVGFPTGVFVWQPPTALVVQVSALLAGGGPDAS